MLVWLTLPFYDFCGFRSVAVNSVYKLQFFYIYKNYNQDLITLHKIRPRKETGQSYKAKGIGRILL